MKSNSRQKKREADFFEKDLDSVDPKGMREICKMARFIYDVWEEKGTEQLIIFFEDELGVESAEANIIASKYNPAKSPIDFCPIKKIQKGEFDTVFGDLALQLPSKNNNGIWPKNILAWRVMQYIYGKEFFEFEVVGKTGKMNDNKINIKKSPLASDRNPMPLGLAALNVVNIGDIPVSILEKAGILINELGEDVGKSLIHCILDAEIIFPPKRVLKKLVNDIKKGLEGEKITITGAFCPDYAYKEVNDFMRPSVQYEYTFDSLGEGVGLVAKQIQRILPRLVDFFNKYNIDYDVMLGIGDFEANSQEILNSVDLNYDEFLFRCKKSLSAFRDSLPEINMELILFQNEFAGEELQEYTNEALFSFIAGDFGSVKSVTGKDPRREVKFLAKDCGNFYKRWYKNPEMTIMEIESLVLAQAAEYAATGKIFSNFFKDRPFIQIAGDRPKMQIFNNTFSGHATLCAKRMY